MTVWKWFFIVKYLHIFILFPFWFQSFDSNRRMCYNFKNLSTTKETLVPQPRNVSHQLLTMAVTSSLFSFYFVIIMFQFLFLITSTNSWTVFRGVVGEWGQIIVVVTPRSTEASPIKTTTTEESMEEAEETMRLREHLGQRRRRCVEWKQRHWNLKRNTGPRTQRLRRQRRRRQG